MATTPTTTTAPPWTCPTCLTTLSTPFCPGCGERPIGPPDLTIRGIFRQVVKALTGVDSRLIRSFRALVNQPGTLTVAYVQGERKPYIGPFQLFFIANVVFFTTRIVISRCAAAAQIGG